jgi:hypothetical protein
MDLVRDAQRRTNLLAYISSIAAAMYRRLRFQYMIRRFRGCVSAGTCSGGAQFPCRSSMPGDDCGSQQPTQINVGGIGSAGQNSGSVSQEAAAKAASFGRADLAAARVPTVKTVKKGETCGDKNGKWGDHKCENSECKQKGTWWGCM